MIALFSALVGFLSSTVPDLLKLFRDGRDRAHEITLLELQIAYDRERQTAASHQQAQAGDARLQEIALTVQQAEQTQLNERLKGQLTGIHWVDALAGTVRPVITYAFFVLYFAVKCAQFHLLLTPGLPWLTPMDTAQALLSLWGEEDVSIFAAVIAFWFGSRALQKRK